MDRDKFILEQIASDLQRLAMRADAIEQPLQPQARAPSHGRFRPDDNQQQPAPADNVTTLRPREPSEQKR